MPFGEETARVNVLAPLLTLPANVSESWSCYVKRYRSHGPTDARYGGCVNAIADNVSLFGDHGCVRDGVGVAGANVISPDDASDDYRCYAKMEGMPAVAGGGVSATAAPRLRCPASHYETATHVPAAAGRKNARVSERLTGIGQKYWRCCQNKENSMSLSDKTIQKLQQIGFSILTEQCIKK